MSESSRTPAHPGSPLAWTRRALRGAWNDLLSVYYANTMVWRLLKSATLLFFGFFLWSGANLLLSYRPDWGVLYYVMAYGFVLLFWGPFTHLVVVPAIIRLRRSGPSGVKRWFTRHGSKANLSVFLVVVLLLGTFPPGVMTFDFQVPAGGGGGGDVNPQLQCTRSGDAIHCHLSDSRGIDHVVVSSGGETLQTVEEPPFDFDVNVDDLATVNGDKQFSVELKDEQDRTIRRYIRRADLIPG
ncbi:MAG TPA: hypothetical protein VKA37_04110 [Halobacteriales archaeon]|nr:hypothetical protein [Halobacteriales archaeon]